MKRILIAMSPICVVLFGLTWILLGLEEAVMVTISTLATPALGFVLVEGLDFVYKHVK